MASSALKLASGSLGTTATFIKDADASALLVWVLVAAESADA